jgi:HK97 family phage portal protein
MPISGKFPFYVPETKILRQRVAELEKRNLERPPSWLDEMIQNYESQSGIKVSEESSLKFAAVWSAVNLLSSSAAQLPYQPFKRIPKGKELYKDHPCYKLIHESPNGWMNPFAFKQMLVAFALLWGNGYARIRKDARERPISLEPIHSSLVDPILIEGVLFYRINGVEVVPARDMIHLMGFTLNGYMGKSPIEVARDNIGLGLAAQQFGSTFFKNGANSEMVFNTNATLTDEQYSRLQKVIMSRQSGTENAHKPLLVEGGGSVTQLTIPPDQAQFIQTRNFQVNEIARIFNVPPHMIGDLERSTNNNIEQQSIEFVQYSLMPWVIRLEEEFTRKLIFESEKPDIFIEANADGLMRGDAQARAAYYKIRWEIGSLSDNEIRAKENDNPYPGGDTYYVPVNYQTVERAQSNITQTAPEPAIGDGDTK